MRIPDGDLTAPLGATFLVEIGDQLGARPGLIDVVVAAPGRGQADLDALGIVAVEARDHPRVVRSLSLRREVRLYETTDGDGLLTLGRGLASRWEVALEIEPAARGRGLGRSLFAAATALVPAGEPVFAQISPGNVPSLRAALSAGYTPIGAEVLLT